MRARPKGLKIVVQDNPRQGWKGVNSEDC